MLQITNCPQIVNNGATIPVSVVTSEPGVRVQLFVTYDAPPVYYSSGSQTSDDGGNATLYWQVRVFPRLIGGTVQARVIAVARDQNGQTGQSSMTLVQVTTA
jgi:predicted secreted protein